MKLSALVMTLALVGFVAHADNHEGGHGTAPGAAATPADGTVAPGHGDHDATKPAPEMKKDKTKKKMKKEKTK